MERLMSEYGNDVLRIAYIYLKDKDLAEDIFQEVYVKIYKNYDKFQKKSSEKTWIMSITINACKDMLRNSWFKRIIFMEDKIKNEVSSENSLDNQVINNIEKETITKEVMNLSPKYKIPILLYYYEDLSTLDISKILNLPQGTVRSRLHRAREILKVNMDGRIDYE